MTAMVQAQSSNIYHINYNVNHGFNETNDEIKRLSHENKTDIKIPFEDHIIKPSSLLKNEYNKINSSTIIDTKPKTILNQSKSSRSTVSFDYRRKKSQSFQLTSIDINDLPPKKTVRFADDFGLDLIQTKVINTNESTYIPDKSFKDLPIDIDENLSTLFNYEDYRVHMIPQFENPISLQNFLERISRNTVILEQANAYNNQIQGTIKLISFGLNKHVKIRLTTDNWMSFNDYDATYINDSYDGIYDRFSFIIEINRHRICIGNNIQFCICYKPFGCQDYWDNNYQQNYRFNCLSNDNI